jgi:2-keto-3-deoxygluconate permease
VARFAGERGLFDLHQCGLHGMVVAGGQEIVCGMRRHVRQARNEVDAVMQILKTINKVPGGLMVVPLFIGMVINTFFPTLLKIGGFTEALSNVGYPTILGMYLFTVGTKMTLRTAPRMLKRGFGIMGAKVGVAALVAVSVGKLFGGNLFGFSALALLVAMSDTNGGMFMALTSVMGDKEDAGTYVPQSIETGPFLSMLILVGAGLANIPWLTMVSVIAPIAAGAVLGNLDKDLREFFGSHEPIIVPFMAFTLGQTINLSSVVTAGLPGVALGVFVLVVTGTVCILIDLLLGGSGIAGAAASSTAGNSAAVPKAVAMADPSYAAIAPAATVQVAASVIVTAVLTPVLTSFVYKRVQKRRIAEMAGVVAAPGGVLVAPAGVLTGRVQEHVR